ncbi:symporter small accessory protein [Sunxiuqinia sp. sy24]|uniref:symporter small accessory protein n=1 Tax=Sunxiuqinia sp. sy24 TaxID=3461495 RepID=UPI0040467B11
MLGINDPSIYLGYLLAVLSLLLCIWYGVKNWNKGCETDELELQEDVAWELKDEQLKEQL